MALRRQRAYVIFRSRFIWQVRYSGVCDDACGAAGAGRVVGVVRTGGAVEADSVAGWWSSKVRRSRGVGGPRVRGDVGLHVEATAARVRASWQTIYRRFAKWSRARVWAKLYRIL